MIKIAITPEGKGWAVVDFLEVVDASGDGVRGFAETMVKIFDMEEDTGPAIGFDPDVVFGKYVEKRWGWHIIEHTPVPIPEDDGRLVFY